MLPCPGSEAVLSTLRELTCLLVWLLRALLASPATRRKAKAYVGEDELGLLLEWWFSSARLLHHQVRKAGHGDCHMTGVYSGM